MTLLGEIVLLLMILCGLYVLNKCFGLVFFYVVVGLFEVFLFVVGKGNKDFNIVLVVEFFFVEFVYVFYMFFLLLIFSFMVLVYVLEGVREVCRFLVVLVVLYVLYGVIDVILEFYVLNFFDGYKSLVG